jgi:hypothetical protein
VTESPTDRMTGPGRGPVWKVRPLGRTTGGHPVFYITSPFADDDETERIILSVLVEKLRGIIVSQPFSPYDARWQVLISGTMIQLISDSLDGCCFFPQDPSSEQAAARVAENLETELRALDGSARRVD